MFRRGYWTRPIGSAFRALPTRVRRESATLARWTRTSHLRPASGISGVSEDELHEIDAKIAQRRRDTDFMDRLHGRHDAERRVYERLAD